MCKENLKNRKLKIKAHESKVRGRRKRNSKKTKNTRKKGKKKQRNGEVEEEKAWSKEWIRK